MIEVIHGHSRAQAEGGQKVPSWSCQRSTEMVPEGTGAAQKHCSRPQVQLRPGPYWAAAWYNIVTTAGGCLTAECGVLRVGGEQFPLLSAGRRLPAASSVVVTGALGYNTCLFFKNVAIPFKSGPWTGSKDSSRTSPCGSS